MVIQLSMLAQKETNRENMNLFQLRGKKTEQNGKAAAVIVLGMFLGFFNFLFFGLTMI